MTPPSILQNGQTPAAKATGVPVGAIFTKPHQDGDVCPTNVLGMTALHVGRGLLAMPRA